MWWSVLRPFRFLAEALVEESTSRQLAWGFALGMVVGLVPKGNLTAVALMMLLCLLRVNLGVGMLAAFAFSWIGVLADPWTHQLGYALLTHDSLTGFWTQLANLPIVPWTSFNNTVVLGSLAAGVVLLFPAYKLSEPVFARYVPPLAERARKFRIVQLLWGAEWAGRLKGA